MPINHLVHNDQSYFNEPIYSTLIIFQILYMNEAFVYEFTLKFINILH